jgi:hypothetical protein
MTTKTLQRDKKPSERVEYCEKVGGSGAAIFDWARAGPTFGADALIVGPPLSPVMGGFAGPESETVAAGDMSTYVPHSYTSSLSTSPRLSSWVWVCCAEPSRALDRTTPLAPTDARRCSG